MCLSDESKVSKMVYYKICDMAGLIGISVCIKVAGSSLTGITVLCPLARHIYPCLVLVQPRKTRPDITEKMLTGTLRIISNNQNKSLHKHSLLKREITLK